jgi:hypothetical protein
MTMEAANTTVTVLRGQGVNAYGDVTDDLTAVFTGIPVPLVETKQDLFDPLTQTPRTVRSIECHLPSWVGLLNTDRIQDDSTGDVYAVTEVTMPPTLIGIPVDTVATLKRITSSGV